MGPVRDRMPRKKAFSSNLVSLLLVLKMKNIAHEKLPNKKKNEDILLRHLCTTPCTEEHKLALARIEKDVGGHGAQLCRRANTC